MNRGKLFLLISIFILSSFQTFAVLNEQTLEQTISVLRSELEQYYEEETEMKERYEAMTKFQHAKLMESLNQSEKISLMLYSQKEDYIFDMAYACHEATKLYKHFNSERMPYDKIVSALNTEITRYTHLIESLESIPPRRRKNKMQKRDTTSYFSTADSSRIYKLREDSVRRQRFKDSIMTLEANKMIIDTTLSDNEQRERIEKAKKDSIALEKARMIVASDSAIFKSLEIPKLSNRIKLSQLSEFMLSQKAREERDTCIHLATLILNDYIYLREYVLKDASMYSRTETSLKSINDYALDKYKSIQKEIFTNGGSDYLTILRNFPMFYKFASQDVMGKYSTKFDRVKSDWRGSIVLGLIGFILFFFFLSATISSIGLFLISKFSNLKFIPRCFNSESLKQHRIYYAVAFTALLFALLLGVTSQFVSQNFFVMASGRLIEYLLLVSAILFSILIRTKGEQTGATFRTYTPIILMGLIIITFRIMFIPNNFVNLVFPGLLILFTLWGYLKLRSNMKTILRYDFFYSSVSLIIMIISCIFSWCGYTLLAVEIFIWWLFLLTFIQGFACLLDLIDRYEKKLIKNISDKKESKKEIDFKNRNGEYLHITWFLDLIIMTFLPICAVLSLLLSIYWATDIFDLSALCGTIFYTNFIDIDGLCKLSIFKITIALSLFYVFKYLVYVCKSIFRSFKIDKTKPLSEQTNMTLADNIIAILLWGIYTIIILFMLQVPKSGISIVTAGFVTGLGFAMKDILNNFIYGISLMSGRARVGDFIECDGIRGKVENITYQSTQILTIEGYVIVFLNSFLFSRHFKNLTRKNGYELVCIPIHISYGSNIDFVRNQIIDAVKKIIKREEDSRFNIKEEGLCVVFDEFGDSNINLNVKFWVLVEQKIPILAQVKEIIYNTLNDNNITISLPQRDIHIHSVENKKLVTN